MKLVIQRPIAECAAGRRADDGDRVTGRDADEGADAAGGRVEKSGVLE